ncbi:MAG: RIP metalloprotease RseP [Anaerolineales bacterium]
MDILYFVIGIALLIFIHELGHFIAAKLTGVTVEEFGMGLPPRVLTLFTHKGTIYSLNAIPLGGFVRLRGELDRDVPGGLYDATPAARIGIMLAGPLVNLVAAALLYAFSFMQMGQPDLTRVQIFAVSTNSPAALAGLQDGDILRAIDGNPIASQQDVQQLVKARLEQNIRITYQRGEQIFETSLTPRANPPEGEGAMGIVMTYPTIPLSWVQALPLGVQAIGAQAYQLATLPVQLIQGQIRAEEARLVGMKGMYDMYSAVRQAEAQSPVPTGMNVLTLWAMISASLGILNLLPIPALDGGRILLVLIEVISRRRLPNHVEQNLVNISFLLLLGLLIYVNAMDFINPADFSQLLP